LAQADVYADFVRLLIMLNGSHLILRFGVAMFSKRLIRLNDVLEITGLSKSQVYALIAEQKFVRQVKISRSSRWPLDSVLAWVDARVAESETAP
jgi:prophage regulatory protein